MYASVPAAQLNLNSCNQLSAATYPSDAALSCILCFTYTVSYIILHPPVREVLTEVGEKSRFFEINRLKGPTGPSPLALVMLYDFLIGHGITGMASVECRTAMCR